MSIVPSPGREVNEAVDVDPSRARYERGDFRLTFFRAAITARLYMAVQPGPAGDIRPYP